MKKTLFQILAVAAMAIGATAAHAETLLVTAAAATDGVGTTTARLAVAVSTPDGFAVSDLTAANVQFNTFGTPVAGACGFNTIQSMNYTAGVYLIKVAMPAVAGCATLKGEYLMSINVARGLDTGTIPVKMTVK